MKKSQLKITHAQKGSKHTKFVEDLYAIEDEDNDEYSDSETSDDDNKETTLQQDDFFTFQSSKSKTSDQTLSDLQLLDKRQTEKLMQSYLKEGTLHEQLKGELLQQYEESFPRWFSELQAGFNLLFYGFGSKKTLLEKFASEFFEDYPCVVGYFSGVNIRTILTTITDLLNSREAFRNAMDQFNFIQECFSVNDPQRVPKELYLLIHNIDGESIRSEQCQQILSMLAQIPNIRIVASVDHINAANLWNQAIAARFNWVWHDVTTYQYYIKEIKYDDPIINAGTDVMAKGLINILKNLTPKARGIFKVLAQYQLENPKENGLGYKPYYEKCRELFLVNSELTMRSQLTEFKDHKVILFRKGKDGGYFFIPTTPAMLKQILEEQLADIDLGQ